MFKLEKFPLLSRLRKARQLGWYLPVCIFVAFVVTAHLIGNSYSCRPVANLYYVGGLAALPLLFVIPLLFFPDLHIAKRLLLGLVYVALGIGVWMWAYDAAGMYFMCRLF
jgi:hypothetical protein